MSQPPVSKEEATRLYQRSIVRKRLDEKGIERVRAEFTDGAGFTPFQLDVMREWLAEKDADAVAAQRLEIERSERETRMEASSAESLRIARSAKNAAWAAAIAAIIAIVVAVVIPFVSKGM